MLNRPLALVVAAAFFMENLDGTIIQAAAPSISRNFGVSALEISAAITAYLLAVAIGVTASGWLANRFGSRLVFLIAIGVFTASSAGCALSHSLDELILARLLQGVGGAMMVPVGRFAVLRNAEKRNVLGAIAYLTWPALVAPLVAPALGGVLADTVGWQWIFLVNLPIGLLVFLAGMRLLPHTEREGKVPFDWVGFALSGVSLAALIFGMQQLAGPSPWPWAVALEFSLALISGAAAARWMLIAKNPLLSLRILKIPSFRVANVGGGLYRLLVTAAPYLYVLLFQVGFGWSAGLAGVLIVAIFAGNVLVKPFTSGILRQFGFRTTIIASNLAGAALFALSSLFTPASPIWVIMGVLMLGGAFRSVGFTAYQTLQFADLNQKSLLEANALSSAAQQVATAIGIAFAALLVRGLIGLASTTLGSPHASMGYRWSFLAIALMLVLPAIETYSRRKDLGMSLIAR